MGALLMRSYVRHTASRGDGMESEASPDGFVEGLSWGAFLAPEWWYFVHRCWGRAAYFWALVLLRVPMAVLLDAVGAQGTRDLLNVAWFILFFGPSFFAALSARRAAQTASPLYDDQEVFESSEHRWTVFGVFWGLWYAWAMFTQLVLNRI